MVPDGEPDHQAFVSLDLRLEGHKGSFPNRTAATCCCCCRCCRSCLASKRHFTTDNNNQVVTEQLGQTDHCPHSALLLWNVCLQTLGTKKLEADVAVVSDCCTRYFDL